MSEKTLTQQAQAILELHLRALVVAYDTARTDYSVREAAARHIKQGKEELAALLREPVDVEALAVGTTFRAPHVNLAPDTERLWVRTRSGLLDLEGSSFTVGAVDPKKVHHVQAPAAEDAE